MKTNTKFNGILVVFLIFMISIAPALAINASTSSTCECTMSMKHIWIAGLFISGCVTTAERNDNALFENIQNKSIEIINEIKEEVQPILQEAIDPKPNYIPTLRPYIINKDHDIWHAEDPSSYITPNNEWVQYYAKNDLSASIIYQADNEMYNNPANGDVWQNVDYTLYLGYGDCEDIAMTDVSVHIAKGYKAMVIGGIVTLQNGEQIKDFWEEIYVNGTKSTLMNNPLGQVDIYSKTPMYMFNDKVEWRVYNENWYMRD